MEGLHTVIHLQAKVMFRQAMGAPKVSKIGCRDNGGVTMAKNGIKIIDAELHVMEPVDLWQRYIDPEFKTRAPNRMNKGKWDIRAVV